VKLILSLAFLSVFAGAIALLILVGKAILRMVKGPTPSIDPTPPPVLRHSYTNAILVTLVIMGAVSSGVLYVIGSALAGLR
jgi:hypothetical protein